MPAKGLCWPLNNETSITRKGHGELSLIQKNCKKWSGSPDLGDRLWPAKSPLEMSLSVSGYPMAVTGVLKRFIVSAVGKPSPIKAAKPRVHHMRKASNGLAQLLLSARSLAASKNLSGVRNRLCEMLGHCLWPTELSWEVKWPLSQDYIWDI